ncbi:putative oxidoreductase GLYR1 homolog, partial [Contarinia nasturtii]|uniref:putative oxidoreductase GLYR1 homolog n=1 Tax=Contarinia nasturtii TaxID=265458 RepID=UPI0012D3D39E
MEKEIVNINIKVASQKNVEKKNQKLTGSDLVWAKQRYSCYWPARIVDTPPEMGKTPKNNVCVLFFGTKQFGFVEEKNIENYVTFREKFVNKCRNNSNFRRAVDEMDNFISDPQKYRSNAVARVIKIKTEKEIEQHLGIKTERSSSH